MTENPIANIEAQPSTLRELVDLNKFVAPGVSLYRTEVEAFYQSLTRIHTLGIASKLDGSVATCSGGIIRSPRINHEFHLMGVKTAKHISRRLNYSGLNIISLQDQIIQGVVTSDGYLQPRGFETPLKTLFFATNITEDEAINLVVINMLINDKSKEAKQNIKMDIIVIPSDGDEIADRGRKFEVEVLKRGRIA